VVLEELPVPRRERKVLAQVFEWFGEKQQPQRGKNNFSGVISFLVIHN
jgi:hypothetical protein